MNDPVNLLLVGAAFLIAGGVKGVIGMGLPTVAVGILSLAMPPAQAAAILVAPSLVTNVWQSVAGPNLKPLLRRLWTLFAGVCVGIFAGAGMLTSDSSGRAVLGLGICLIVYALLGLSAVRFHVPRRAEPWLSPLVGLATGLVTGATGIFVIPAVPYLQALDLDRDDLVQALGLSFTTSTLALAYVLTQAGILQSSLAGLSLLAIAPALAGMVAGQMVRGRIPPDAFRICFFVGMLLLGAHLALRVVL